jgi:hypothetical protein
LGNFSHFLIFCGLILLIFFRFLWSRGTRFNEKCQRCNNG